MNIIIENISKNIVNLKVINEKLISENEFLKNQLNQINNQINFYLQKSVKIIIKLYSI